MGQEVFRLLNREFENRFKCTKYIYESTTMISYAVKYFLVIFSGKFRGTIIYTNIPMYKLICLDRYPPCTQFHFSKFSDLTHFAFKPPIRSRQNFSIKISGHWKTSLLLTRGIRDSRLHQKDFENPFYGRAITFRPNGYFGKMLRFLIAAVAIRWCG